MKTWTTPEEAHYIMRTDNEETFNPLDGNKNQLKDEAVSGEAQLWKGVLVQALKDLTIISDVPSEQQAKRQAEAWLDKPSEDLELVCVMAGMDMHQLLEAKRKYAGSVQTK